MSDEVGLLIIAVGVLFDLFGCIGLVRLPDVYTRLQAGTKCVTLGVCLILIGSAVMADATPLRLKAALCVAFIAITSRSPRRRRTRRCARVPRRCATSPTVADSRMTLADGRCGLVFTSAS